MKNITFLIFIICTAINLNAQTLDTINQDAAPKYGLNKLAIKYFGIEFSKEQRNRIKDIEIELIFEIDNVGTPILSEVNGISDQDIIDSLKHKTTHLENFHPMIRDGVPMFSIYFMQLTFPSYQLTNRRLGILQGQSYNEANLEDFEYIHKSGQSIDVAFSGLVNQFIGSPASHLRFGGGFSTLVSYTAKNYIIYGLNMKILGNKLKNEYPINSLREQFSVPPTLLVGLTFGKKLKEIEIQGELDIAVHNITPKLNESDNDWVQLNGWSPGVIIKYPIRLGKETPIYYYGAPSLLSHNLDLHLGLRYLSYPLPQASGFMFELGIGYKMSQAGVKEYKLK